MGPKKTDQRFTVSHYQGEGDFKSGGLRTYAKYRDLGFTEGSNGRVQAHVIRFTEPCSEQVRKRHYHDVELQMVYILNGWMKIEVEGQGEMLMRAGTSWLQPAGIPHTVLDYSADCEVLEINVPADFKTINV